MKDNKFVPPYGPLDTGLLFVGEAPASQEVSEGKPFVGTAGYNLNRLLNLAGIDRNNIRFTNLSKVPALHYKMELMKVSEREEWEEKLIEEINSYEDLRVIVPLGNYALKALTGRSGITKFRGSPMHPISAIKHKDAIICPTIHPATMLYDYEVWPLIVADLTKINRLWLNFESFEWPETKWNFISHPSLTKVFEILDFLEDNKETLMVDLDVETPNGILSCFCLAWSEWDSICIPFIYGDYSNYWTKSEELLLWRRLGEILPQLNIVNQNYMFDWEVLQKYGIYLKFPEWDPMLMHHCIFPSIEKPGATEEADGKKKKKAMRHGLDLITSIYTDLEYYKEDERNSEKALKGSSLRPGGEERHWKYNNLDGIASYQCIIAMEKELIEDDLMKVYQPLYVPLFKPLFEMGLRGVRIDVEALHKYREELKEKILFAESEIEKVAGSTLSVFGEYTAKEKKVLFNPSSPKQTKELLCQKLEMQPYRNREGKVSMNKDNLKKMAFKHKSEIPMHIINIKSLNRDLGLFSEDNVVNGRVHCKYSLSTSTTGRLASQKQFDNTGMNLQNVKRSGSARSFFIPEKDNSYYLELYKNKPHVLARVQNCFKQLMLKCDQKQAEARVVAWLSEDEKMILVVESGRIHLANAENILGKKFKSKEEEKAFKETEQYPMIKATVHGGNYDIGYNEFARMTKCSKEDAQYYLELYHQTYPGIRKIFHKKVQNEINKCRVLRNPFGRRITFFGRMDRETYKLGYAFIPQSTITDINKIALSKIYKYFLVLMDTHDGLNISIPDSLQKEAILITIWAYRSTTFKINDIKRFIPVDVGIGPNWAGCKDINIIEYEKEVEKIVEKGDDIIKYLAL